MILCVASGKGGTGKTTLSVSLALVAGPGVRFLDCDVEEPNAHLFLRPRIERREVVSVPTPVVDEERCTHCGECARACAFHALAVLPRQVLVFPELCHGCGACALACPEGAISERPRRIGLIEEGRAGALWFAHGVLDVGQPMPTPVVRQLKRRAGGEAILDCPPGTSCPVVEAMRGADFCLLVTEPTPFGLYDLRLALQVARALEVPAGVVVNRCDVGDGQVRELCRREGVPVLMEIPWDRRIAEAYAEGVPLVEALPEYADPLRELHRRVRDEAAGGG